MQQLSWGKPSPLSAPDQQWVQLAMTAGSGGRELSQRLSKVETAIFRRKTILFEYYTLGRDDQSKRKVDPYHLLFRGGQFYLVGYAHERDDIRVFRLSRILGKVGYSSKAEHDFQRPEDFDPRTYATRANWQLGDQQQGQGVAVRPDRMAGAPPSGRRRGHPGGDRRRRRVHHGIRRLAPVDRLGAGPWPARARILEPPELVEEAEERVALVVETTPLRADRAGRCRGPRRAREVEQDDGKRESTIRPERFARLVRRLAGILIDAARRGGKLELRELTESAAGSARPSCGRTSTC